MTTLSFVLPLINANELNLLEDKLQLLSNNDVEIIIVTRELISKEEQWPKQAKLIRVDAGIDDKLKSRLINTGVDEASGKYVLIDEPYSIYEHQFIEKLKLEIEIEQLDIASENFILLPTIEVSASDKQRIDNVGGSKNEICYLINKSIVKGNNNQRISFHPIVISKHHFLSIGGMNDSFSWPESYIEFVYRLATLSNKFLNPINKRNFLFNKNLYEGFWSKVELYSEQSKRNNLYVFTTKAEGINLSTGSEKALLQVFSKINADPYYLGSRINKNLKDRTCLTSTNPFVWNHELWPLLGEVFFYDDGVHSEEDFLRFVLDNEINNVIMQNPYKKENKLKIYKRLKENNINCIVAERGALPNSVYFDSTGFCCESKLYSEAHWNKPLSENQENLIDKYLKNLKETGATLEKQSSRLGGNNVRQKLKISQSQKILFVTFQTKKDSTVTYFAGKIGSYDNFVDLIQKVTDELSKDWVVLYKNHPLEPEKNHINGAICVDEYHINDILEISSLVVLMNSGCGVLALAYGVPVIHCAQAQYDNQHFNRYLASKEEILEVTRSPFSVDQKLAKRFLYYLVFEFYSFAKNVYIKPDGTETSKPCRLEFGTINYLDQTITYDRLKNETKVSIESDLYCDYRYYLTFYYKKNKEKKNTISLKESKQTKKQIEKKKSPIKDSKVKNTKDQALTITASNHPIERGVLKFFINKNLLKKYDKDRDGYFRDSKSNLMKAYFRLRG